MKKLFIATAALVALGTQAFAEDGASARRDAVTVFPPITQTLDYTYSAPLRKPQTSPAAGTLAQVPSATDAALVQATGTQAH